MNTTLNASSRILQEEAEKMGIRCTPLGDHETLLMEKDDKHWYTRGSRTSLQSSVGKTIADLKPLTKKVLAHFKLPTAKFAEVASATELKEKLNDLTFPLVMKPIDERHGKGVIVGLNDMSAAEQAYESAGSARMLFEEMLVGTEYRVVCVDFKFAAAAFRKPAHVTGDGQHTIEQLIAEKNQHPWRGTGHQNNLSKITVDEHVEAYLSQQGLTVQSVLATNQEALLRRTANLSTGGEAWDVSAEVSPVNRRLFETIARACDLNVVGIDVMCSSLSEPIVEQPQAGVIEVNASPGLRMHHYPIKGQPVNVAALILTMVLNQRK